MNDSFNPQAAAEKTRDSYRKNVAEFDSSNWLTTLKCQRQCALWRKKT
jgi:hypothetical protein